MSGALIGRHRDDSRVTACLTNRGATCPTYQDIQLLAKLDAHDLLD